MQVDITGQEYRIHYFVLDNCGVVAFFDVYNLNINSGSV